MEDRKQEQQNTKEMNTLSFRPVEPQEPTVDMAQQAKESEYVAIIQDLIQNPENTDFLRGELSANEDTHEFADTLEFGDTREVGSGVKPKRRRPQPKVELTGKTANITELKQYEQTAFDGVESEPQQQFLPHRFVVSIPEEPSSEENLPGQTTFADEPTFDQLVAERNDATMDHKDIGKMFRPKKLSDRFSAAVREITEDDENARNELDNEPDKDKIRRRLDRKITRDSVRQFFLGLFGTVLLFLSTGKSGGIGTALGSAYFWAVFSVFAIACILGMEVFEKAVVSLIRKRPTLDFLVLVLSVLSVAQAIVVAATDAETGVYLTFPVWVMFFIKLADLSKDNKVAADLKMLAFKPVKTCGGVLHNAELCKAISGEEGGKVAHTRHLSSVRGEDFFTREYSKDGNESIIAILCWCALIASVLVFLIEAFVNGVAFALTATTATLSLLAPSVMAVVGSLAYTSFSKRLRGCGASVIGVKSVSEIASAKTLVLEDRQLFPVKSMQITGMKQYGAFDSKELLISVVSIFKALSCPLSVVLFDLIDQREDLLIEPDKLEYFDGRGVKAEIAGTRFIIGNRKMMAEKKIALPSDGVADKIENSGKIPLFVSVGGTVTAVFSVNYQESDKVKKQLHALMQHDVVFSVKTRDPSLTPDFIAKKYEIPFGYLKLMPDSVSRREDETADVETSPSLLTITKDSSAYLRAHTAAFRMASATRINRALLIGAFCMGAVSALLMLLFGQVDNPLMAVGINLIWSVPILAVNEILKQSV